MAAIPYMPFPVLQFSIDTMAMDAAESGAYAHLLMAYWLNRGPLDNNEADLAMAARLTIASWHKVRPIVAEFFKVGERWSHQTMDDVLARLFAKTKNRPTAELWRHLRDYVFRRDDFTCLYCGRRGVKLECDHVHPVSKGGDSSIENLVTACFECNRSKRNKSLAEWKHAKGGTR